MFDVAKVEVIRAVFDFFNGVSRHFINFHRSVEVHPLVVELKLERRVLVFPVRFVMIELNLLVVCEFEIAELGR